MSEALKNLEGSSPEKLLELYQALNPGELTLEELPDALQDAIRLVDGHILIEAGIFTVRGILWALATEVWVQGIAPSYD